MNIKKTIAVLAAGLCMAGGSARAEDMVLSKAGATELIQGDIGKPYWIMEAECAGSFGAAYAFQKARHRDEAAEQFKAAGISLLNDAVARLQTDRGLDQADALNLAAEEVEVGRANVRHALERQGAGENSYFNFLRSACLDISAAQRRQVTSR